jgi:hypothetical protein
LVEERFDLVGLVHIWERGRPRLRLIHLFTKYGRECTK